MSHVALLGDSIFDNRVYVAPQPAVRDHLQGELGADWMVTLVAVDGHVTADVHRVQVERVPADTSHMIVSVGGNDALRSAAVLAERVETVAQAVSRLAEAQATFAASYDRMLASVLGLGVPTAVCTIYDANHPEPQHRLIVAALALFNDVITRAAFTHGLALVDLRLICNQPGDYANPIEPSSAGGLKIARAIAGLVRSPPAPRSSIWT